MVNELTGRGSPHAAQREAFEKLAKQGMPIVLTARGNQQPCKHKDRGSVNKRG